MYKKPLIQSNNFQKEKRLKKILIKYPKNKNK